MLRPAHLMPRYSPWSPHTSAFLNQRPDCASRQERASSTSSQVDELLCGRSGMRRRAGMGFFGFSPKSGRHRQAHTDRRQQHCGGDWIESECGSYCHHGSAEMECLFEPCFHGTSLARRALVHQLTLFVFGPDRVPERCGKLSKITYGIFRTEVW